MYLLKDRRSSFDQPLEQSLEFMQIKLASRIYSTDCVSARWIGPRGTIPIEYRPVRAMVVHASDLSHVRVFKTCRSLARFGFETHFVGWDRVCGLQPDTQLDGVSQHIFRRQGAFAKFRTIPTLLCFLQFVYQNAKRLQPRVIVVANYENALPIAFGLRSRRYAPEIICDVHDSIADRQSLSKLLTPFLQLYERLVIQHVDAIVVTDDQRQRMLPCVPKRSLVIYNSPPARVPETNDPAVAGDFIFLTGNLSESRGLRQITEAVERVASLRVVAAGWLRDKYAREVFIKHPKVEFLGAVSMEQSLGVAAKSVGLLALYSPTTRNNINASPNKVFDAMMAGRPVIVNSEALISKWVVANGFGYCVPYNDVSALAEVMNDLRRERTTFDGERTKRIHRNYFSWEMMEKRYFQYFQEKDLLPHRGLVCNSRMSVN